MRRAVGSVGEVEAGAAAAPDARARARAGGRGVIFFRPAEAADFLGVSRAEISAAMREYTSTRGRRGLAHFVAGKGAMIRRCAIFLWCRQREMEVAGR